jgi:hypothetical protein
MHGDGTRQGGHTDYTGNAGYRHARNARTARNARNPRGERGERSERSERSSDPEEETAYYQRSAYNHDLHYDFKYTPPGE